MHSNASMHILPQKFLPVKKAGSSPAFLRSFIKQIEIDKDKATVHYHLPLPNSENGKVAAEVLPIVHYGGDGVTIGRTFELIFNLTI